MDDRWPQGVGRVLLDEIDSTNAEVLRRSQTADGPLWLLSRRQTAGRGRRGRAWADPAGNFAASLLLFPRRPPTEVAQLSFVAALALGDALAHFAGPAARLTLKWPNDVLLNGGKVAGILLEGEGAHPQRPAALAIGIGVNLQCCPDADTLEAGATAPVSLRGETGAVVDPEMLLDQLAPAFAQWQGRWDDAGFAPIRAAWLARAARLGQPVTARIGATARTGIFEGIGPTGALILNTPSGREQIAAADIHFAA